MTDSSYVAPERSGSGPPVLLLHTWWGLNQPIKELADRLAGDGFTVLAPDLFDGKILTTIEEADAHGQEMDNQADRILGLVSASIDELLARPDARGEQAGIVALSFGAWYAGRVSAARSDIAALVSIYGDVYEGSDSVAYQGHFAEDDQFVDSTGPDVRAATERGEAYVYPGTSHWFMEYDRPEYEAEAAELAYARTVEFLLQHLR